MTITATIPSAPTASAASHSRIAYSKSLLLRKVPRRSTIDDIKTVFETFGPIRDIYIPVNLASGRKETYAFIEFENLKSSMKAFEYFSTNEMLLEGIILRVDYAKNGRRSPEQMGTFASGQPAAAPPAPEPVAPVSPFLAHRVIAQSA